MRLHAIYKKFISCGIFLLLFFMLLGSSTFLLCAKNYYRFINGFYSEQKNSLDAVIIGNSSIYYYWQAPMAWREYGITVYPFSSGGQPIEAMPYLIKEARKQQPGALIIVGLSAHDRDLHYSHIHHLADWIPFSMNKTEMLWKLAGGVIA